MSQAFAAAFTMVSTRYGVLSDGQGNTEPPSPNLLQFFESIPIRGLRTTTNTVRPGEARQSCAVPPTSRGPGANVNTNTNTPGSSTPVPVQRRAPRATQDFYKAPIFKLPSELLSHIFDLALPSQPREPDRSCVPLSVSQTCIFWRRVALATPAIWGKLAVNIHLNPTKIEEEVEFREWCHYVRGWLSRAGASYPLELNVVTVVTDPTNKSPFGVARRRPDLARLHTSAIVLSSSSSSSTLPAARPPPPPRRLSWFGRPTTPTQPTAPAGPQTQPAPKPNPLAQFLLPLAPRVRVLELKMESAHLDALRGLWTPLKPEAARWSALEEFRLNAPAVQGKPYRGTPASLANLTCCPNLRSVAISSPGLNLVSHQSRFILPLKQLRSLRLREEAVRYANLLQLLRATRYLRELTVLVDSEEQRALETGATRDGHQGYEAPYLKALRVHSTSFDPALCLRNLMTPSLTSLAIDYSLHFGDTELRDSPQCHGELQTTTIGRETTLSATLLTFHQQSYFQLHQLFLNSTRLDQLEMVSFLSSMPTLETLELQNCGCTTKYFVGALRWWWCPAYTSVTPAGGAGGKKKAMILPKLTRLVLTDLLPSGEPAKGTTGIRVGSSFSFEEVLMDMVESRWWTTATATATATTTTTAATAATSISTASPVVEAPVANANANVDPAVFTGDFDEISSSPSSSSLSSCFDAQVQEREGLEKLAYVRVVRGVVKKGAWRDGRIGNNVLGRIRKVASEGMDIWYTKGGTYQSSA
ncbi:hypothetical protein AX16_006149 [Volvariella volvacea WC 439]|nr:hypothetical protein AX16_006149 [Volvariella volvacea WC 439]